MKRRRRRAVAPSLPTPADKRGPEWGARQAEALWLSLYAPRGATVDGRVVLDLGCAWGYMLRFLAERFAPAQLIGVDPSGAWARGEHGWDWPALGDLVHFHKAELTEVTAVADASVDLILCSSVFQYLAPEALEETLARCRALLRPGGEMILRTRCVTSSLGADLHRDIDLPYVHLLHPAPDLARWMREHHDREPPELNWLTATTYVTLFGRAGFEVLHTTRRANARAPHVRRQVADEYPWIGAGELDVAELEAHLVRPVAAEDLRGLGPIVGGHVGADPGGS